MKRVSCSYCTIQIFASVFLQYFNIKMVETRVYAVSRILTIKKPNKQKRHEQFYSNLRVCIQNIPSDELLGHLHPLDEFKRENIPLFLLLNSFKSVKS